MSTPNDSLIAPDVLDAACELICRKGDGQIVHIGQLLEGLGEKFGQRLRLPPEAYELVWLIECLWEDPHIDQPQTGWIEFAWNETGRDPLPITGLKAMLPGQSQISPLIKRGDIAMVERPAVNPNVNDIADRANTDMPSAPGLSRCGIDSPAWLALVDGTAKSRCASS